MTNRPLTQKEIDLAPEWATHYFVTFHGDVTFENDRFAQILCGLVLQVKYECNGLCISSTPIPRKPFNIESVEWSDTDILNVEVQGDLILDFIKPNTPHITHTKQDIINKAKALGITPEDLK